MQLDRSVWDMLRLHPCAGFDLHQIESVPAIATEDICPDPDALEGKRGFVDGVDKRVSDSL